MSESKYNLQIFENEKFGEIRICEKNGQFWFVGKDVTNILDYQNGSRAINMHIDNEDKGVSKCDTPGGKQERGKYYYWNWNSFSFVNLASRDSYSWFLEGRAIF